MTAYHANKLIATRWASTLKSARLKIVMCANSGYLEGQGMMNFACRVARCALQRSGQQGGVHDINIIAMLKDYAERVPGLREAMGDDFARGHKQVSLYGHRKPVQEYFIDYVLHRLAEGLCP